MMRSRSMKFSNNSLYCFKVQDSAFRLNGKVAKGYSNRSIAIMGHQTTENSQQESEDDLIEYDSDSMSNSQAEQELKQTLNSDSNDIQHTKSVDIHNNENKLS